MGEKFYRLPINVTFQGGVNHVGVMQNACTLCGDCVAGCNYSAKNTTLMNYLPDAHNHGAEIYTEAAVERVEPREGRWVVYYRRIDPGLERFRSPLLFVTADLVVLAAGSLGSTEILLRSRDAGLPMSDLSAGDSPATATSWAWAITAIAPCTASAMAPRTPPASLRSDPASPA